MRPILRDPAIRRVLTTPATWRLIYHGCDALPVANTAPELKNWLRTHLHEHSCLDIMMVLRGRGEYGLDGQVFGCRPGTIFIFLPHQPHPCGYPPDHGDFVHLWIGVMRGEVLARALTGRHNRVSYSDRVNSMITLEQCGLSCPLPLPAEHMPAVELRLRLTALVAALLAGLIADNSQRAEKLPDRQTLLARKNRRHPAAYFWILAATPTLTTWRTWPATANSIFCACSNEETHQTVHTYVNQCRRRSECVARQRPQSEGNIRSIRLRLDFGVFTLAQ